MRYRLGILYPGNRAARDWADTAESRFSALFEAFQRANVAVEPAVYHDDFCNEVRRSSSAWMAFCLAQPDRRARDRKLLDDMLRDVASSGMFVSAHPDTILKMGTMDVLLAVRDLPLGSDTIRVDNLEQPEAQLLARLGSGARVLKQRRGHSGIGVWRVEQREASRAPTLMRNIGRPLSAALLSQSQLQLRVVQVRPRPSPNVFGRPQAAGQH